MHPLIKNLSVFTWMDFIESNEKCIAFLENLKLIPKRTDQTPPCPKCSRPMKAPSGKSYTLGWHWDCKRRKKGEDCCRATVNPLKDTFFAGTKLPLADIVALIFAYILNIDNIKEHMDCWRRHCNQPQISPESVSTLYAKFDQIILSALSQRNKTFGKLEQTRKSRGKLLKKYRQKMDFYPAYKNIVYQFLMDMKHQYPGYKTEVVSEHVDSFASTNAADTTSTDNNLNEHSSETDMAASSVSAILKSSTDIVRKVNVGNINASTSKRNKTLPDNSNDIGRRNLPTSTASPVLKSSSAVVHNVSVGSAKTSANAHKSTTNPSTSDGSDLPNLPFISDGEDITTGNENNTEAENLMASDNAASPITDNRLAATPVSLTENSNSSLACIIVDNIVHNVLFYEERNMDIDHG